MNNETDVSEYLAYVLGKFSGRDLSEGEGRAAFMLLRTLSDNACIKDFVKSATNDQVDRPDLPDSVAEALRPLLIRLEFNLPYAGRFASLRQSGT